MPTYTWKYGVDAFAGNTGYLGPSTNVIAGDADQTNDFYLHVVSLASLRPGLNITINEFSQVIRLFSAATGATIRVYDATGNQWVGQSDSTTIDKTGWTETNSPDTIDLSSDPVAATITDGSHFGLLFPRVGGGNAQPGHRSYTVSGTLAPDAGPRNIRLSSNADPTSFDLSTEAAFVASLGAAANVEFQFTTEQELVTDISAPHTSGDSAYFLPELTSGRDFYSIKLQDVVVSNGNTLTVDLQGGSGGVHTASETVALNFSTDNVVLGGNNVSVTGEDGDTFDVLITVRVSDGAVKVAWINKTTGQGTLGSDDHNTIDHAAARLGTRNTWEATALGAPRTIHFNGTGTVGRLQVSAVPIIIHADSQSHSTTPINITTGRLTEALFDEFESLGNPQMYWLDGQGSGNQMKDDTPNSAGTLTRFDTGATNIGTYDINDTRGRHVVLTGINDFATDPLSLTATMEAIADQAAANANTVVFADVPPASSVAISKEESDGVAAHAADVQSMFGYNAAVFGTESSHGFFSGGLNATGAIKPRNIGLWFNVDELHYLADGAALKAGFLAPVIINGGQAFNASPATVRRRQLVSRDWVRQGKTWYPRRNASAFVNRRK